MNRMMEIRITRLGKNPSSVRLQTLFITKRTAERLMRQIGTDDRPSRPTPVAWLQHDGANAFNRQRRT